MSRGRATLDGFAAYLGEFGISAESIAVYQHHAKRALESGGWLPRLKSDLAPKTKRLTRAAARHWADYTADDQLRVQVKRLRLPAPMRKTAKTPLPRADLFRVMAAIEQPSAGLPPAVRAVLGMMACRGFRDGDVLRMQRLEVRSSLAKGTLAYEAKGHRRLEFKVIRTYLRWLEVLADQPGKWERVDDLVAPHSKPAARRATAARVIQRALAGVGADLGIVGLHPHRLRRTYAVQYLRAIKDNPEAVMMLQQHMQWAKPSTAMEYIDHLRGDELDDVAETLFDKE